MNFKDNFMISPFILGSVVNGGFERKLRMLRADLWTLLSISESCRFIKSTVQSDRLKKGVVKFTEKSQDSANKHEAILLRLKGWNKIVQDKIEEN